MPRSNADASELIRLRVLKMQLADSYTYVIVTDVIKP